MSGEGADRPRDAAPPAPVLTPEALEQRLREIGEQHYHHRHPFNVRMHAGTLTPAELRCWARNRYYYQTRIPLKDSLIVAKAADAAFRREWVQRIHDHDGAREGEGGLALWLELARAVGCDPDEAERLERVLPGVRRACDAYVELVESSDLLTSVAASLTEMFAGDIMRRRIEAFERHYPWVDARGLAYFHTRTQQAPRDAAWGLDYVLQHARSAQQQARCIDALLRKCEILWSLLDAVERACARPRLAAHAMLRHDAALGAWLVVLPERAVRLGGSGLAVLERCDGTRSSEAIVDALAALPGAGPRDAVAAEIDDFLLGMQRQGVVHFGPAREGAPAAGGGRAADAAGAAARDASEAG